MLSFGNSENAGGRIWTPVATKAPGPQPGGIDRYPTPAKKLNYSKVESIYFEFNYNLIVQKLFKFSCAAKNEKTH